MLAAEKAAWECRNICTRNNEYERYLELGLAGNKEMNFRLGDRARCHNYRDWFSSKVIRDTTTDRDVI
jgi:hypothetical protein